MHPSLRFGMIKELVRVNGGIYVVLVQITMFLLLSIWFKAFLRSEETFLLSSNAFILRAMVATTESSSTLHRLQTLSYRDTGFYCNKI